MDRKIFGSLLAFVALLLYLSAVIAILFPYLTPLLWGTIIGMMTYPLYRKLCSALKERKNLAAALMTPGVMIILVVPLVALIVFLAEQGPEFYSNIEPAIAGRPSGLWNWFKSLPPVYFLLHRIGPYLDWLNVDVQETLKLAFQNSMDFLVAFSTAIIKKSLSFSIKLIVMAVALFFIYRDGNAFMERIVAIIPLEEEVKRALSIKIKEVLSKVLYGLILASFIQGILASAGYALAKIPGAVILGALTAVAALIPVVGTTLVWVPVGLYFLFKGMFFQGIIVLVWGALVISPSDNLIRVIFMSGHTGSTYISPLVVLLGLLGGVSAFGFIGIILGPLILSLLFSILDLFVQKPSITADLVVKP